MATKLEVEFELKYKEAVKNLNEFQKEYSKLETQVVKANEKTADALKKVEKSADDGAKGVQKVGASLKNIAKVTGVVFLLQKAFEFVSSAIQENQQVMDALNVVFETAQILFNQVANVFIDVYKNVSSATENFDALGKVVKGLVTIAFTPLKLTIDAIKLGLLAAQLAWEESFFGDGNPETIKRLNKSIDETKESLKETAVEAVEAGKSVVTNFAEAVTEVGEIGTQVVDGLKEISVEAALETAKTNIQLKKSAEIAAAESRGLIEQYDRQAEQQRQIRDEERNSIEDRIKANNELKKVLELQEKQMLANAETVLKAAEAQFELTGKDEDYIALLDARNEKLGVLAQIEGFRSEQKSNDLALDKEQIELINSKIESESKLSIEQKRFNAEQIQDELLRLEALKEIDLLEAEQETIRLQAIVDNANAGTQAKIDAQIALDEFMAQSNQTSVTREKEISKAKIDIAQKEEDAKKAALNGYASALSGISGLIGQETAAGKAIAIASSLVNTYAAIAGQLSAFSKIPVPGYAIAQAIATGVVGLANVKKIASVKIPNTSSGGSSATGSTPTAPAVPSLPPAFNIVGSSETNQLADAIGGQSQQPIQAFVVASEVTSAQALERNTIEGATIG